MNETNTARIEVAQDAVEAAYEGMWALGDGARVQIKHATRDDVLRHRQLQKEDLAREIAADAREEHQTDCYFPYMTDNTVTVPQAVARWRAAQQTTPS